MATTSIWKVSSSLGRVVDYAKDTGKAANPKWSNGQLQAMCDVMDYATDDFKTEKRYFVTGLNCDPAASREQMRMTKRQFRKTGGILAFHGYQSFAEGEVTAERAHKIGVELAGRLWPDFQVFVATHLNTKCYHNHFVLNSVSFVHGGMFNNCKATYRRMREVSDELCRKYALSVVAGRSGNARHYAQWQAEQAGRPTWRSAIREDVDKALAGSVSFAAFVRHLKAQGYEVKTGVKYIAVRPPGKERFVRLRSLGEGYTENEIRQKILNRQIPTSTSKPIVRNAKPAKYKGTFTLYKVTWKGLRALYFYYLYKLRKAKCQPENVHYLIREDLRHMDRLTSQAKFLYKHGIDTEEQLTAFRKNTEKKIVRLIDERRELHNEKRRKKVTTERTADIDVRIRALSRRLKELRRDARMCDTVIERAEVMREKKVRIGEMEQKNQHKGTKLEKYKTKYK